LKNQERQHGRNSMFWVALVIMLFSVEELFCKE
jgi:hypothetical protein